MPKNNNQLLTKKIRTKDNLPFYKNYMLVLVLVLPFFMVIVCIIFVFWSVKVQDSTVRDDWYMDGKALYQDASLDKTAYDLGVAGIMRFDSQSVQFELNPKHTIDYPKTLTVLVSHATNKAFDQEFVLTYQKDNIYIGKPLNLAINAKYYITIKPDIGDWRLITKVKLPASNVSFVPLTAFKE